VEKLRRIRREKGLSQQELSALAGVGQDSISAIETGKHEPHPRTLRKLAKALNMEVAEFFKEPALPLVEASGTGHSLDPHYWTGATLKASSWIETLEEHATRYEGILERDSFSLAEIQEAENEAVALAGLYGKYHRELRSLASAGQWQMLETARDRIRSVRRRLREASREKFEEERDRLDPGKVRSIEQKRAELDRRVKQEERDAS
jgi:transcriptional regulator with XRE-family HTH domain